MNGTPLTQKNLQAAYDWLRGGGGGPGQRPSKTYAQRFYLYTLWRRFQAGEDVGRLYVTGPGWKPPKTTGNSRTVVPLYSSAAADVWDSEPPHHPSVMT